MSAASVLFAAGKRPDRAAVRALAPEDSGFTVSPDPATKGRSAGAEAGEGAAHWLELLTSGLTFDLCDLAPGPADKLPLRRHSFGLTDEIGSHPFEAITLRPGPHLAGGQTMIPVIRCLAWLTAQLANLPGSKAVAWHPASSWSALEPFQTGVLQWFEGGVFPGLSLTALAQTSDGGLQSERLDLFVGQELRLEPGVAADPAVATKIGLRLLHWLVGNGPLHREERMTGPSGERLRLAPSAKGCFVRVWKD